MIFLRTLGLVMLVFSWTMVFSSRVVVYRKSRVPMSWASKLMGALTATGFCVATFGIRPLLWAALSATCAVLGFWRAKLDRRSYEERNGRLSFRPTGGQEWLAFFALDVVLLFLFVLALIRDQIRPPVTAEQRIVHNLGVGLTVFTAVVALLLYWTRPRKPASETEQPKRSL